MQQIDKQLKAVGIATIIRGIIDDEMKTLEDVIVKKERWETEGDHP